jgi:segregation and condensation protein A
METENPIIINAVGLELKLPQFSGPMDLLLHMIRENQLNIHDIPICQITEAYLGVIRRAQEIEFQVAGEFLVMASLLLYLKSRTLLPPEENELEEEDPKENLVQQLIAYEEAKAAAEALKKGELLGRDTFIREDAEAALKSLTNLESDDMEIQASTIIKLATAYINLLKQNENKELNMAAEPIDYKAFFNEVINKLSEHSQHTFDFSQLSTEKKTDLIQRVVLTILVILELSKRGVVQLSQEQRYGSVNLEVFNTEDIKSLKPDANPDEVTHVGPIEN